MQLAGIRSQSCEKFTVPSKSIAGQPPNNSLKPTPLRSGHAVAEKACHGVTSTTLRVLAQALGHIEMIVPPPEELTGARVLAYALIDESTPYSGRITLYVDGELIGPVPRLVIALNNYEPDDYLLLYCNENWDVIGAGGYASLVAAKESANIAYPGVASRWQDVA